MNYKGYTINTATTPAPWGETEQQMVQDQIDTLTTGTLEGASQTTGGHQHTQIVHLKTQTDPGTGHVVIVPAVTCEDSTITLNPLDANGTYGIAHPITVSTTSSPGAVVTLATSSADGLQILGASIALQTASGGQINAVTQNSDVYITSAGNDSIAHAIYLATNDSDNNAHTMQISSDTGAVTHIAILNNERLELDGSAIKLSANSSAVNSILLMNQGGCSIEMDTNMAIGTTNIVFTCAQFTIANLPTSSAGLPTGTLWNSSGTVMVV